MVDQPAAVVSPGISLADQQELLRNEELIREASLSFLVTGRCLKEIHARSLWRGAYPSFEDYCLSRWDMGRTWAYDTMASYEVVTALYSEGVAPGGEPRNIAQCIELAKVKDPAKRAAIWKAVTARHGDRVTREAVKAAVRGELIEAAELKVASDDEVRGTPIPERPSSPEAPYNDASDRREDPGPPPVQREQSRRVPLHDDLPEGSHGVLDAQVALWDSVKDAITVARTKIRTELNRYRDRDGVPGGIESELRRFLTLEGPDNWRICRLEDGGCGGEGNTPIGPCVKCRGIGFRTPFNLR